MPLAQKPNRKAALFGGKCKCITISTEQVATHVPTPGLEGQETVFVRPLTNLLWETASRSRHTDDGRAIRTKNPTGLAINQRYRCGNFVSSAKKVELIAPTPPFDVKFGQRPIDSQKTPTGQ
ncbi:hypothetical protein T265_08078 [Opisthorchis viverrini]|uniref:Uncharacterized protein n=1 Tax=Opisthorchis viverrini TaxID=6198 RepID=A0A074ZLK7_OPIVI|nr:hypothetical protein T265_08078 [Opisthorchis viverrini]KER24235.1 hypothetical protein T265_08078 [Opisthorchis viverrini]